jgi:MFS family permease
LSTPARELRPFIDLPRGLAPLGYRNFALYWIGLATSNSGTWVELAGGVWLVSELTDSAALLGLLGLFRGVPAIVLGPLAGVVADRVDQRRLLLVTQAAALVASLGLGIVVATGLVELWHIYLQVAVQAVVQAFDAAARQSMFPRLVPRSYRTEAVTLTAMAGRTGKFIGPSVGGIAIASFGVAAPFLLNAVTFLALMAAVVLIRGVTPRTAAAGSSIRSDLTAGARYIMGAPVVGGLLKMEAVYSLFQMNAVMITSIGRQVLDVGPAGLGGLLSAPGFGALVGLAYLLIAGHTMRQGRFIVICTAVYAAGLVVFAVSREYAASLATLAVIGLFDVLISVTRQSVIQLTTPGRMRGRVIGTTRMVTGGVSQFAQTQSGLLSSSFSGPIAVLAAAAVLAVSAGTSARTNRALWGFSREETPGAPLIASSPPPDVRPT